MKFDLLGTRQPTHRIYKVICLIVFILSYACSSSSYAGMDEVEKAIGEKNYSEAFRLLSLEDEPGPKANYYLGLLNYYGLGVEKNTRRGLELLKKSGEKAFKPAMVKLVEIYKESYQTDVVSRVGMAFWISNLAETEDPFWQRELGALYRLGIGVQKSDKASFLMIAQSALNGYGPAMLDLYYAFNRGLGTDKDKEQALRWLKGAASKGVEGAQALWEKENGVINYQTLVSKNPSAPKVVINYSLACNHCLDFLHDELSYYLDQAEQGHLSIVLREMPFRLRTESPNRFGPPTQDIITPSFYVHCIRSQKGPATAANALVKLATTAEENILPTQDGSDVMDWRILGHPIDGSAIRNFQSKNEMYESLLRAYSVDVSECSPQQYSEYVENIANVNEGGEANTFEFNDKKYAPSIFDRNPEPEPEKLRRDVERYLSKN